MMGEAIKQRGGHLGIAKDARPFPEGKIGGDDDRRTLVEPADQMEQELAAGLGEGQIAEFIEDNEVHAGQMISEPALAAGTSFCFEAVDEVDDVIERVACAGSDAASGDGDGKVGLAGAGRSSDILPGIRATGGFIIRFTRDVGRLRLSFGVSVSNVETSLSFINSMGRWRIFHAG